MRRPTYSQVVSTLALFVALGGTTYAATLPTGSVGSAQLRAGAVTAPKVATGAIGARAVAADSLTGDEIRESTLGTVPSARRAGSATNASRLGGAAPSSYVAHCPSGMFASRGLCIEPDARPAATFRAALQACADLNRRLPSLGEAAQSFNALGGSQPIQWVDTFALFRDDAGQRGLATLISSNGSRAISIDVGSASTLSAPFRCIATPFEG